VSRIDSTIMALLRSHGASVIAGVIVILVTLCGYAAWAQAPRTIRIIVPLAPSGPTDTLARLLAEQIGRSQGVTMVVENRPGAGTAIGAEAAARAAPDGNTLLIATPAFVINPHLRKLSYDPLTSFESICYLANTPTVIVVNDASPYRTLADLLNAARARPGELTLASVGPGTGVQLAFEMLKREAGINMTFIPYPGYAPAVSALLGGHVTSALTDYSVVQEQLKAGKLRALATGSRDRFELLPDVPTVAESGYKDYEADTWYGLFVPAKPPKETVLQLAGWFTAAVQAAEIRPRLLVQGLFPVGICGADFAAFIRRQSEEFGRVIRESNVKGE